MKSKSIFCMIFFTSSTLCMDKKPNFCMRDGSDPHVQIRYQEESIENLHGIPINFLTSYHSYNKPLNDYMRPRIVLVQLLSTLVSQEELKEHNITHGTIDLTKHIDCPVELFPANKEIKLSYDIKREQLVRALEQRKQEMLGH